MCVGFHNLSTAVVGPIGCIFFNSLLFILVRPWITPVFMALPVPNITSIYKYTFKVYDKHEHLIGVVFLMTSFGCL